MVQVPFPPQNFRAFAFDGKATPISPFPVMQLHPQWPFEGVVNMNAGRETSYHISHRADDGLPSTLGTIRRPFFYPVIGPDGIGLTEFGKPHDPTGSHKHHYSLWIAHHDVNGKDFWSDQSGSIVHEQLALMEDGPVFCRIVQKTRWIRGELDLMHERPALTAYETPDAFPVARCRTGVHALRERNRSMLGKTTFGFLSARVDRIDGCLRRRRGNP